MKRNLKSGFTLMEVILVIALMGIIFGFTAFISMDSFRGSSFRNERDSIVGALQRARGQAMNNVCIGTCATIKPHGVHFENGKYTIFQGADWSSRDASVDEVIVGKNPSLTITGFTDVIFTQLSGDASVNPSGNWDLSITDSSGHTSVVSINSYGQIIWTN